MEKAEATNVTMGRLVAVVPLANAALSNCTAALLAYVAPRAAIVGVLVPSYMVMVPLSVTLVAATLVGTGRVKPILATVVALLATPVIAGLVMFWK